MVPIYVQRGAETVSAHVGFDRQDRARRGDILGGPQEKLGSLANEWEDRAANRGLEAVWACPTASDPLVAARPASAKGF